MADNQVKTFGDALIEIWKSCKQMIEHCKHIDFVFNLYLGNSIKLLERQRRAADESIRIVITHIDQELPSAHQSNNNPPILNVLGFDQKQNKSSAIIYNMD